MDVLHQLAFGFSVIFTPETILSCLIGVTLGTFIGVLPGPLLIKEHPEVFWGLVASMYLGNGMLLLLNLPLVGLWVRLLKVPYRVLFPLIILFTIIGSYSISGNCLLLFALFYMREADQLGISTASTPAPGFFPFILGGCLSLLALILLVTTYFRAKQETPGLWHGLRWQKTFLIMTSLIAYTFLVEPLGYLAATLILMIYLFKGIEPQTWQVALCGAILSSGVTYVLFRTLLQIQLPRGIFNLGYFLTRVNRHQFYQDRRRRQNVRMARQSRQRSGNPIGYLFV